MCFESNSALVSVQNNGRFWGINHHNHFCARCTAQIAITKEGNYKFTTASDDGSVMSLNGRQIVDNNGCHGERERTSGNQWLTPGYHLVGVDMCEKGGGEAMKLRYQGPDTGNRKVKVPQSALKHEKAGLECKYIYHRHHCWLPDLGRLHSHHTVTVPDIWMENGRFPAHRHGNAFCMRCSGYLVIRKAGHYLFWTASDDGVLAQHAYHAKQRVVDNNGCHGERWRQSSWWWLGAGKHRLTADMCEHGGGEVFKVMYQGPDTGNRKIKIPKEALLKPGQASGTSKMQAKLLAKYTEVKNTACPIPEGYEVKEALDTVTADFRQHGTLKSGSRMAILGRVLCEADGTRDEFLQLVISKHAEKITCRIYCDDVLVHEEYHNHIGHKDREVNIPEICKGARKVRLEGGGSNGGTCGFKSNRLEVFKLMPTRTLTKSEVSTIKDRAYSCRARYWAAGQVTIKLDEFGEIAPGNKVNFGHHVFSKCEVHCNGKKQTVYSGRRRHRHRSTFDVSKECIGATEMVLKGGGHCGGCQIDKGQLKVSPYPTHPSEVVIPAKKIVAWFKSEDAGPVWRSSVGKFTASARRRTGVVAYTARGYGAKAPIRYIQGHTGHAFDFGKVLQDHYTVCAVTRYLSAGATGRILTGSKTNYLFGHHAVGVGLAYSHGWQTATGLRQKSTKWLTMCASPGAKYVFVDGVDVGTQKTDHYVDQHLLINSGPIVEKSDWAVAELITWNYILTREEMKEASTYLMKKLMVGGQMDTCKVILKQPEHWKDERGSYDERVLNRLRLHKSTRRVDLTLDSTSGWCASSNHGHKWVEIDLRAKEKVMGIILQTLHKSDDFVYAFKVQYKASEKGSWITIPNRFTGMSHKTEDHVRAYFAEAVEARFVRLTDFWWHRNICLRAAVMLCKTNLDNEVNLLQARTCPTNYNSESWSESDSGSRHLRIGGSPDCLRVTQTKKRMALLSATCVGDDVHQMIPSSDIGYLFTMLHRNSWLQDNVLLPGLKAEYFYNLKSDSCVIPDLTWRAADKVEVIPQMNFWKATSWAGLKHNDKYSARMSGVLMINEPGWYHLWLAADDASRLFLNHKE
ncbi:Aebp1, partial [Symbiodinium necroappetens]